MICYHIIVSCQSIPNSVMVSTACLFGFQILVTILSSHVNQTPIQLWCQEHVYLDFKYLLPYYRLMSIKPQFSYGVKSMFIWLSNSCYHIIVSYQSITNSAMVSIACLFDFQILVTILSCQVNQFQIPLWSQQHVYLAFKYLLPYYRLVSVNSQFCYGLNSMFICVANTCHHIDV